MDTDNTNISRKVVVITGASSGLGEATARYLADRGATVILGARRGERLEVLVDAITEDVDINEILFRPTRQEL